VDTHSRPNPVASLAELTGSLSNFAAVLTSPAMRGASAAIDSLSRAIGAFTAGLTKETEAQAKGAPSPASEETNRHLNKLILGEDTSEGAIDIMERRMGGEPGESVWDVVKRRFGWLNQPSGLSEARSTTSLLNAGYRGSDLDQEMAREHARAVSRWQPSFRGASDWESRAGALNMTVSGQAQVEQTLTVRIEPSALLTAIVDQARQQSETTVPLIGGGSGRMDSDAGSHRGPGIGKM
jgi:hypothetical protein